MIMNPELFTVKQNKEMGLWPPSDIVGPGIAPYIKRIKKEKVRVLDVGIMKGENAVYLIENCPNARVYGINEGNPPEYADAPEYAAAQKENLEGLERYWNKWDDDVVFDVVCINAKLVPLDNYMDLYYNKLSSNGIFCGNEHHLMPVKEALVKFRKKNKIGTPIQVSNGCWFWIKR